MKKLLSIIVLGLLLSSNAYAICDLKIFETKVKKNSEKDAWYQHVLGREYLKTFSKPYDPDYPLKDCKIEKNIEKGKELIQRAIEHNYSSSLIFAGWSHYKGEYGYEKNIKVALDYTKKAAYQWSFDSFLAYSNLGYFYYSGEELKQDLDKATEYFIDAAYQILMVMKWQKEEKEEKLNDDEIKKYWDSNLKEIIEEINKVPNPTSEMIKLRDAYTGFLKYRDSKTLRKLKKMGKDYTKDCYDEVKFTWEKNKQVAEFNFSNKTIKITDVAIKTKTKELIAEKKNDLVMPPFTENFIIIIPKGNLMLELAKFASYECEIVEKGNKSKKSIGKKLIEKVFGD